MNFEPARLDSPKLIHIHKSRKDSYKNIVFLLIPILLFVAAIVFISSKTPKAEVSGVSTDLTQESIK